MKSKGHDLLCIGLWRACLVVMGLCRVKVGQSAPVGRGTVGFSRFTAWLKAEQVSVASLNMQVA